MNIRLEELFAKYELSTKDRYDFLQIYNLLPSHKKVRVVENFSTIMKNIDALKDDLYFEQEILFGRALENIGSHIATAKKNAVSKNTGEAIAELKNTL